MNLTKTSRVFFSGIGGSGMSALARLLLKMGYTVLGSDLKRNILTEELSALGAQINIGQQAENIENIDVLVASTAIKPNNPELLAAKELGIPVYRRAECLSWIMDQFSQRIAVTGTHGKTTTSSLLAKAFTDANCDPSFAIGSVLHDFNTNAALGSSDIFIAEADESDGSFLCLNPTHAIVTNLEEDHMDFFETVDSLYSHFNSFIDETLARGGYLYLNADDEQLMTLLGQRNSKQLIYFSLNAKTQFQAKNIRLTEMGTQFDVLVDGNCVDTVHLKLFGLHHVYNALSVIALMYSYGIDLALIKKGLESFSGVKRRFEFIGETRGVQVFDDYGHHPTEITKTLEGIKHSSKKHITCIFQPHRYSRTHYLMDQFTSAFDAADRVIITDVFSAQEKNDFGVSSAVMVKNISKHAHPDVQYIESLDAISPYLCPILCNGDLVITMGAGDVHQVSKVLLDDLKQVV